VNEPWIKHFLTNTLEMAVKGEKGILTSEQDGGDDVKGDSRFLSSAFISKVLMKHEEQEL
jgi:hypothetical protein